MKGKLLFVSFVLLFLSFPLNANSFKNLNDFLENKELQTQIDEILQNASKLSQNEQYLDAINYILTKGFIFQEEFSFYFDDSVYKILQNIKKYSDFFVQSNFMNRFSINLIRFTNSVDNDNFVDAQKNFKTVTSNFNEYAKNRNAILKEIQNLQKLNNQERNSKITNTFFSFICDFVLGKEKIDDSGIIGILDLQWNSLIQQMSSSVFSSVTSFSNAYLFILQDETFFAKDKVFKGEVYIQKIKDYTSLETDILNLYDFLDEINEKKINNPFYEFFILTEYINNLCEQIKNAYSNEAQLDSIKNDIISIMKNIQSSFNREQLVSEMFDLCLSANSLVGDKSERELENFEWAREYNYISYKPFKALSENYSTQLEKIFEISNSVFNNVWEQISNENKTQVDKMISTIKKYNQNAKNYYDGFPEKLDLEIQKIIFHSVENAATYDFSSIFSKFVQNDVVQNQYFYKYASLAYQVSSFSRKTSENFIKTANRFKNEINEYYNGFPQWKNDVQISNYVNDCVSYISKQIVNLNSLKNEAIKIENLSKEDDFQSQVEKNEGDIRFSEAENALKNKNFSVARKKLQESLSKYEKSLQFSDDEQFRIFCDEKIKNLGEEINRLENEIVVKDVRVLKNKATDSYLKGEFDEAEKYLNQAKIRWSVTNTNDDEEILSLLNYVNIAISMQTGREIKTSAPQYPEMSQLLNIATQYFESGTRKYNDGNINSGNKDFDRALQCIQKVQLVYPLSQEASVLNLKITQLKNPQKFDEEFAQNIKASQEMCKDSKTLKQGYSNLLDYYAINPNYKGLKDIIYQVEIDIGIRQKPIDNSSKNKAKDLFFNAKKQFQNANENLEKLQNALELVDESLLLNPNDENAKILKDNIIIKMGGTASSSLSIDDERLYNQAIRYLQNNNIIGANQILLQLLKKPQNQYSKKIKELKAKIDARI